MDDKRLGENKVLYSFSGVKQPIINYYVDFLALPAPEKQISGYLPVSGSRTTLTRIPPYHLSFLASFRALLSTSCRSPLFPLHGELVGHEQSGV